LAAVPVVLISGTGLARDTDVSAIVRKPIDFAVLKKIVEQNRLKELVPVTRETAPFNLAGA